MKKIIINIVCVIGSVFFAHAQTFYAVTRGGGAGGGTIIKFIPGTNNLTVARSFETTGASNPNYSNFIQGADGKLYGTANFKGGSDYGAIVSYDIPTSTYTRLKNFDNTNGAYPLGSLVLANDGKLYGMTPGGGGSGRGVIFSFAPSTSSYAKLFDFDYGNGANASGSLIQASDGKLYGMTREGGNNGLGVIFSFDPSTYTYTRLKDFDGVVSGSFPNGSLIQASNGKLYGMTNSGGSNEVGVIFSFDPATTTYTRLKDFDVVSGSGPNGDLVQASNGKLYGTTMQGGTQNHGVIFSFDPASSAYTKLKDFAGNVSGASPAGNLLQAANGKLYGMTVYGWSTYPYRGYGSIFSFDISTSIYTKVKDFGNPNESASPYSSLMQASDGKLYGISDFGVIFSFNLSASFYAKLIDLNVNDGRDPYGSLMQASDGKLYGITNDGGCGSYPDGRGVIFSYEPFSSTYRKLADFTGYTNGSQPLGSLMQANNGKLYGMTWGGTEYDAYGVIYSFDPSTSAFTRVLRFQDGLSQYPLGKLVQASNGKLYGMTSGDVLPSNNSGTVFSYDPLTSSYTMLVDFSGSNGGFPTGSLVLAGNGKLYGMTTQGGRNGMGVIFSFDPVSSVYRKLEDFDGANGAYPYGCTLVQANDGKLYGMTNGGGSSGRGIIFSLDIQLQRPILTKLKDFDSTNGAFPRGSLMMASNGKLYGMATSGGSSNRGVIFSFDPSSSTYTKLQDFNGTNGAYPDLGAAFIELQSGVVPVTLISFNGKNNGNLNQVSWKVENEINLKYYELQRSIDGQNFTGISLINAVGNNSYNYNDLIGTTVSPVYYYRLKIVDIDGKFTYSKICIINFTASLQIIVSPNPVKNILHLTISSGQAIAGRSPATINIYSSTMQLVETIKITQADRINLNIPVEKFPPGIYFLQLVNDSALNTIKFLKE
ncbi:MAG: choice-of-anchor tandem repeat GloVer-containing protein [Ferruginibacter sp.]